jgi:hypothetical protein
MTQTQTTQTPNQALDAISDQFLQLAEAVVALMPPARGRRHVKIIERGKKWVMYRVVTDGRVKVAYVD